MTSYDTKGTPADIRSLEPVVGAPTLTSGVVLALLRLAELHGLERGPLLQQCDIPEPALADPDARIPYVSALALWSHLMKHAPEAHLGLEFAPLVMATDADLPRYVLKHARNLGDALNLLVEFQSLVDQGRPVDLVHRSADAHTALIFALPKAVLPFTQPVESLVASSFELCRRLAGEAFTISSVRFQHPRSLDLAAYVQFFGIEPEFDAAATGFEFPSDHCSLPVLGADPILGRHLAEHARLRLRNGEPEQALLWRHKVRDVIAAGSKLCVELEQVAKTLGLSPRTLQRRLADEGSNFERCLDDQRRRRAAELMACGELSLDEIADRLAYADRRSLQRAHRRWQLP